MSHKKWLSVAVFTTGSFQSGSRGYREQHDYSPRPVAYGGGGNDRYQGHGDNDGRRQDNCDPDGDHNGRSGYRH